MGIPFTNPRSKYNKACVSLQKILSRVFFLEVERKVVLEDGDNWQIRLYQTQNIVTIMLKMMVLSLSFSLSNTCVGFVLFIFPIQVKKVFPLGFYSLLAVPPVLTVMNLFWFWKIAKGMMKTLSKARHRQ